MAVNIDAKFGGKLFCAFKNDMGNLAKIQRLKSSDSILENKTKSKSKFKTTRSTRCSMKTFFYLGNKWIAQWTKRFTHVLQNGCSYSIRKFPRKLST